MRGHPVLWCALIACCLLGRASPASAQSTDIDPEAVVERCVNAITDMADTCVEKIAADCERCVARIREALEAGQVERAERLARLCLRRINAKARLCLRRIDRTCHKCARVLQRLGIGEDNVLFARLRAACEAQANRVREARARAEEKIKNLLDTNVTADSAG